MSEHRRSDVRPTVLILDNASCEHFDQLAATLRRRHGVRVVRITSGAVPSPRRRLRHAIAVWLRERFAFDARLGVRPGHSLQGVLDESCVVDLLANENTLATLGPEDPLVALAGQHGLAFTSLPPHLLIDKFAVNAVLERSGIRIPAQISARDMTPAQAAELLGLPIVVKARVGAAGAGVRVANSVEEIHEALTELQGGDRPPAFYQQHIDGRMVMYCVVCGSSGPVVELGVMVDEARWALGPSARLHRYDDTALLAAGRLAVQALGCLGFAEIGFLQDATGVLWHIDANCRPWGNLVSLLGIGIDFPAAYAALIFDRPHVAEPAMPTLGTGKVSVLPFTLYEAASRGSPREVGALATQLARMCRRGPGAFYAMLVAAKVATVLMARLGRKLRRLIRTRAPKSRAAASRSPLRPPV